VPANDDHVPVRVEFAPRIDGLLVPAREQGLANDWIVLNTSFQPVLTLATGQIGRRDGQAGPFGKV
jgi:hypothetical protein